MPKRDAKNPMKTTGASGGSETIAAREFDFALVADGVKDLDDAVEDAMFEAGCDDATLSWRYGRLHLDFSREAPSFAAAVLSAIRDVHAAGVGARVMHVDACEFVTMAEIARRSDRSRQVIHQYVTGQTGPGGFPPPEFDLTKNRPLWSWSEVSFWLAENQMVRRAEFEEASFLAAVNGALAEVRQRQRQPEVVREVRETLGLPTG